MAENIGRADYQVGADTSPLTQDLKGAEDKMTATGERVERSAISTGTAFKTAGIVAAAGFGLMAKGADEMESAQGRFQAATGRSAEEALAFSKDMNGLVGTAHTVGTSFDDIVGAGLAVSQQFGITGEDATRLTEDILAFAKVTGQDAEQAAFQLEDTLSAFNLTAEDAAPLMDALVTSNQKFGTDAGPKSLGVLQGMAPALQAMGEPLETGVGLLNLFETAGLDAGSAQKALQKAVLELKPGESLDDLIARIGAVEDPTKRAQLAMEMFGTKSGVGLANAIKPGMTGLDDFKVSFEDADGAVRTASEQLVNTSDKIKMFAETGMKHLRDFGSEFGPLGSAMMGFASLGAPFIGKLAGAFKGLASSGVVTAAAGAAGSAIGAIKGAAMAAAATGASIVQAIGAKLLLMAAPLTGAVTALGGILGTAKGMAMAAAATGASVIAAFVSKIAAMAGPLTGPVQGLGTKMGGLLGPAMAIGAGVAIGIALDQVMQEQIGKMKEARNGPWRDELREWRKTATEEQKAGLDEQVEQLNHAGNMLNLIGFIVPQAREASNEVVGMVGEMKTEIANEGAAAGRDWAANFADGGMPVIRASGEKAGTEWGNYYAQGAMPPIQRTPEMVTAALDRGLAAESQRWQAMGEKHLTPFKALGEGIPGAIGKGMMDNSRQVLSSADALRDILKNGLTPEQQALEVIGKKYVDLVRRGIESEIPGAKQTAQEMAIQSIATIEKAGLEGAKGQKGLKAIGEYYDLLLASGLTAAQARVALAGGGVADATIDAIEGRGKDAYAAGVTLANKTGDGLQSRPWASWGAGAAGSWVNAFTVKIGSSDSARSLQTALARFGAPIRALSPPREGPLRHIDKWGANAADAWISSFTGMFRRFDIPLGGLAAQIQPLPFATSAIGSPGGHRAGPVTTSNVTININGGDLAEVRRVVEGVIRGSDPSARWSHS
jgi:hypothetical protein